MSLFAGVDVPCPSCGTEVSFEVVNSVNAASRPDLRDAIIEGSFQKQACGSCGKEFRMDPRFSYIDAERGQWMAVYPETDLDDWRVREEEVSRLFDHAFGSGASQFAREIGDGHAAAPRLRLACALGEARARRRRPRRRAGRAHEGRAAAQRPGHALRAHERAALRRRAAGRHETSSPWLGSTARRRTSSRGSAYRGSSTTTSPLRRTSGGALRTEFDGALFVDMKRLVTAGA